MNPAQAQYSGLVAQRISEQAIFRGLGLFLALVCAVSLTGRPGITAEVPGPLFLAAGALAVGLAVVHLLGFARISLALIPCLLLPLWAALCAAKPLDVHLSHVFVATVTGFCAVALSVHGFASRASRDWRTAARVLLSLLCASLLYALVAWWGSGERLKGNFTNPDCYCVLLLMGYFLSQSLLLEAQGMARGLHGAGLLLFYVGIFLSGSRAGWSGLLVGSGVLYFTLWASRPLKEKLNVVLSVAIPSLVLLIAIPFVGEKVFQRFTALHGVERTGVQTRIDVATYGLRTVQRYWLTGSGGGSFHLAYQQDRPESSRGEGYMNVAHNDAMQWAVETGVPGVLLWITSFATVALSVWRKHRAPTGRVAGCLAFLTSYWVYSFFNFASPVPSDMIWLGAALGLAMAIPESSQRGSEQPKKLSLKPYWFLFLALGLYTARLGYVEVSSLSARREAAEFQSELNWAPAYQALEKAVACQPEDVSLRLAISACAERLFYFSGNPDWLKISEGQLREAVELSPRNLDAEVGLAEILSSGGRYQEAREILERCEDWAASNNMVQRALARNCIYLGEFEKAFQHISALSSSQSSQDRAALCELLLALEGRKRGQGVKLLTAFHQTSPKDNQALAVECATLARSQKRYVLAVSFFQLAARWAGKDPKLQFELAQAFGDAGREVERVRIINQLRRENEVTEGDELGAKIWRTWAEIQLSKGKGKVVASKLEEYLLKRPRDNWPRFLLAQRLESMGRKADARNLLREGVSYDEDGSLRMELAEMCRRHKLYLIAKNYYTEALPLVKNKDFVRQRIAEMQRLGEKDEDMMLDEPDSAVQ